LRDSAYDGGKFAGIPHAAVYVIDKKGIVRWAKVESNYQERPANEKIRKVLDALR
jgi:alkyl hydroperoxide reductase subunit AhpC